MNEEITNWLPLLITFIAGAFALSQIRSNNITNARIEWLQNLKHEVTDFLAECAVVDFEQGLQKRIKEKNSDKELPENAKEIFNKINESFSDHLKIIESKHNLILLNLNPKEPLHQKLEKHLNDYMQLVNEIPKQNSIHDHSKLSRKIDAHGDTLILLNRYIMKLEWEKTKQSYLWRKWYMKCGKGKQILKEALNLKLLPERAETTN